VNELSNIKIMTKQKTFIITVICGMAILLALIIVRAINHDHFRNDATKWAEKSIDGSNLVDLSRLNTLNGNVLIVNITSGKDILLDNAESLTLDPDKILIKSNFKQLHDHCGSIVLVSEDIALGARMWMLLSQMGIKNLYILKN